MIVTIITPGIRGAVVGQCRRFPLFQLAPPARSESVDPQAPRYRRRRAGQGVGARRGRPDWGRL